MECILYSNQRQDTKMYVTVIWVCIYISILICTYIQYTYMQTNTESFSSATGVSFRVKIFKDKLSTEDCKFKSICLTKLFWCDRLAYLERCLVHHLVCRLLVQINVFLPGIDGKNTRTSLQRNLSQPRLPGKKILNVCNQYRII